MAFIAIYMHQQYRQQNRNEIIYETRNLRVFADKPMMVGGSFVRHLLGINRRGGIPCSHIHRCGVLILRICRVSKLNAKT
jgi:hypothetical protein